MPPSRGPVRRQLSPDALPCAAKRPHGQRGLSALHPPPWSPPPLPPGCPPAWNLPEGPALCGLLLAWRPEGPRPLRTQRDAWRTLSSE